MSKRGLNLERQCLGSCLCKKEFQDETDARKHRSLLEQMYTPEREVLVNPENEFHQGSHDQGFSSLSGWELVTSH